MTDPNTATPTPDPVVDPIAHEDSPVAANIVDLEPVRERLKKWRENLANGDHRDNLPALIYIEALLGITPGTPANDTAKV